MSASGSSSEERESGEGLEGCVDREGRAASPVKRRKGAPKSMLGCLTCKIRRKRCDEHKPSCNNCTSTGRVCEFSLPASELLVLSSRPSALKKTKALSNHGKVKGIQALLPAQWSPHLTPDLWSFFNQQEANHFEYFLRVCRKSLSGYFEVDLLDKVIPRLCTSEPAIRNAAVALASIQRELLVLSPDLADAPNTEAVEEYIKYYDTALQQIRKRLDGSIGSFELAIVASILFTAIDVLRSDYHASVKHLEGGSAILKELVHKASQVDRARSRNPYEYIENVNDLVGAFSSLKVQASVWNLTYTTHNFQDDIEAPKWPQAFGSFGEARDSLNAIIAYTICVTRPYDYQCKSGLCEDLSPATTFNFEFIRSLLQGWKTHFALLTKEHPKDDASSEGKMVKVLLIHYFATWIQISNAFTRTECSYDSFQDEFSRIVSLSEQLLYLPGGSLSLLGGNLSFQLGVVQPLYLVACHDRDPHRRRRAISLMLMAGREGVWHGEATATIASWAVAEEEAHAAASPQSFGLIPEESRLWAIRVANDRGKFKARVMGSRRTSDGTINVVADVLRWGRRGAEDCREDEPLEWWIDDYKKHVHI